MTWICREPTYFHDTEKFRVNPTFGPGDLSQWMAVPWQADFYECAVHWWPSQRPDNVRNAPGHSPVVDWDRGVSNGDELVEHWSELGVILPRKIPNETNTLWEMYRTLPEPSPYADLDKEATGITFYRDVKPLFRESDRNCMLSRFDLWDFASVKSRADAILGQVKAGTMPMDRRWTVKEVELFETWISIGFPEGSPFDGMKSRDYFQYLMNIDKHSDFIPYARRIAIKMLKKAEERFGDSPLLQKFQYSQAALSERLETIYQNNVDTSSAYDPASDESFPDRESVLFRIRQMAPFNQTDGIWLRGIPSNPPITEVQSILFGILNDELGGGDLALNHAHLYDRLLREVGIELPPINSHSYAQDPNFLDSAFDMPLLQMAVSQFSSDFFPEILGFTLNLEWNVVAIVPTLKLLKYYGIDNQFYQLHVGIDNASTGHGAMAKRAVELYLDEIGRRGGADAVQAQFERIWRGYVAFETTGTLGEDMSNHKKPSLREQVKAMIVRKGPYGARNHGDRKIGGATINSLFADPDRFLEYLDKEFIVPGKPEESTLFDRMKPTGPMFKVFSPEEIELWKQYILQMKRDHDHEHNSAQKFADTLKVLRLRQSNCPAHQSIMMKIPSSDGKPPQQIPLSTLLEIPDDKSQIQYTEKQIMQALIDNGFVVANSPEQSSLLTNFTSSSNAMGKAFQEINSSANTTHKEVLKHWIQKGCNTNVEEQTSKFHPQAALALHSVVGGSVLAAATIAKPKRVVTSSLFLDPNRKKKFGQGCIH